MEIQKRRPVIHLCPQFISLTSRVWLKIHVLLEISVFFTVMKARRIACVFVDCLKKSLIFQSLAYVAGGIVWVQDWSFGGGAGFQKKFVGFSLIGWFNWDQLKWQKWAAFEKTWFSGRRYFSRLRRSWQLRRQISLDCITTAPPPNLTRLLHNTASYAGYSKPCSWCQVVRLDLVFRSPAPGNWNWGWAQLCLVSGVGLAHYAGKFDHYAV